VALGAGGKLDDPADRHGAHPQACVRHHIGHVESVVDHRLEDDDPLAGDLCTAQTPDHLFALSREHRPADDLEPAPVPRWNPDHGAAS
jgi:hypothetical protein